MLYADNLKPLDDITVILWEKCFMNDNTDRHKTQEEKGT